MHVRTEELEILVVRSRNTIRDRLLFFFCAVSHLSQNCVQVCDAFEGCGAAALGGEAAADCQIHVGVRGGHRLGQTIHGGFQLVQFSHDLILPGLQGSDCRVHLAVLERDKRQSLSWAETTNEETDLVSLNYSSTIQFYHISVSRC